MLLIGVVSKLSWNNCIFCNLGNFFLIKSTLFSQVCLPFFLISNTMCILQTILFSGSFRFQFWGIESETCRLQFIGIVSAGLLENPQSLTANHPSQASVLRVRKFVLSSIRESTWLARMMSLVYVIPFNFTRTTTWDLVDGGLPYQARLGLTYYVVFCRHLVT